MSYYTTFRLDPEKYDINRINGSIDNYTAGLNREKMAIVIKVIEFYYKPELTKTDIDELAMLIKCYARSQREIAYYNLILGGLEDEKKEVWFNHLDLHSQEDASMHMEDEDEYLNTDITDIVILTRIKFNKTDRGDYTDLAGNEMEYLKSEIPGQINEVLGYIDENSYEYAKAKFCYENWATKETDDDKLKKEEE